MNQRYVSVTSNCSANFQNEACRCDLQQVFVALCFSALTRFHHPFLTARGRVSMPGPRQFAALTRVGHDTRPHSRGLSEGGNEPNRNERNYIMARTTTNATTEPKTPAFQAWHVTNKGDDSFWTKVGAAWPHRDGKGLSLILSVIPMNGQIVLRQPLSKQ
jgi:hypothetical protein